MKPCNKVQYRSKKAANRARDHLVYGADLNVYWCDTHHCYHLGNSRRDAKIRSIYDLIDRAMRM